MCLNYCQPKGEIKIIFIFSLAVFGALICLFYSLYGLRHRSKITEQLTPNKISTAPFLENLWGYPQSGLTQEEIIKYAVIITAISIALGIFLQGLWLSILLGIAGFTLGPKLLTKYIKRKFVSSFRMNYARAISSFSAAAKVMPVRLCFKHISNESHSSVSRVFGYISTGIEDLDLPPHKAILKAAEEFELNELNALAEVLQILDEIGGGEHAGELLDAVAEEARFQQRHMLDVKSQFGELKMSMLFASAAPIILFLVFYFDKGDFGRAIDTFSWITPAGIIVLLIGWGISQHLITKAAKVV